MIRDAYFGDDFLSTLVLFLVLVSDNDRLLVLVPSVNDDSSKTSSSISDDEELDGQRNENFSSSFFQLLHWLQS